MKRIAVAGVVGAFVVAIAGALLVTVAVVMAQDAPELPGPGKEHKWLEQFAGAWEVEGEATMAPGQPPMKSKGTESARMLGGFWLVSEQNLTFSGMTMNAIMTIGYDPEGKKYIGTWIDSTNSYLWKYDGSLDAAGKVLTLKAEGPNPMLGGKLSKFQDVVEFKSKDHKVLTSSMQGEDGKWISFMTTQYRRKKA